MAVNPKYMEGVGEPHAGLAAYARQALSDSNSRNEFLQRQQYEEGQRKELNKEALLRTQSTEGVNTLLEALNKTNVREEYEAFFGSLTSDPNIRRLFDSSKYHYDSFVKSYSPNIKFGNSDLRQKAEEEEQLRSLTTKARIAESPEMRRFVESSAKLQVHRARMEDVVHIMDLDTNQVSDPLSRREAEERMKSQKAGRARILSAKEYQEPVFVYNPNTQEYEEAVYGQLEDLRKNEFAGRQMRVLNRQEYMKQQVVDSWINQTGMKVSVAGHLLTRDLDGIRDKLLALPVGQQRSRELARMLESNMLSVGRSGKTSAEEIKEDLLESYLKVPMEMQGAKVYDPSTQAFVGVTEYRNRLAKIYEAWRAGILKGPEKGQNKEAFEEQQKVQEAELSRDYSLGRFGPASPFRALMELDRVLLAPQDTGKKKRRFFGGSK